MKNTLRFALVLSALFAQQTFALAADRCLPFFDNSNETVLSNVLTGGKFQQTQVDITPPPVKVTPFGSEILAICGDFGKKVSTNEIRQFITNSSHEVFKALRAELPNVSEADFRDRLTQIWADSRGFEHIFCGQRKPSKIGGLHFAARYYELQVRGDLCRLENNIDNEEVLPGHVYTMGVKTPDSAVEDPKKGYSLTLDAEDIFLEASRAYLRNCMGQKNANGVRVCGVPAAKDNSFMNQFVCAPGHGIVTFYSMAKLPQVEATCK